MAPQPICNFLDCLVLLSSRERTIYTMTNHFVWLNLIASICDNFRWYFILQHTQQQKQQTTKTTTNHKQLKQQHQWFKNGKVLVKATSWSYMQSTLSTVQPTQRLYQQLYQQSCQCHHHWEPFVQLDLWTLATKLHESSLSWFQGWSQGWRCLFCPGWWRRVYLCLPLWFHTVLS